MRLFLQKGIEVEKRRLVTMLVCMAVLLAVYIVLTWQKAVAPVPPVVIVQPVEQEDVEIYGDYVGRIRAQQFVEVRARVEGFLESMAFEEGTYVTKIKSCSSSTRSNIVPKQIRLVLSCVRILLWCVRPSVIWSVSVRCLNRMQPVSWTWIMLLRLMKRL